MTAPNTARGEVSLRLGAKTYVLKPEHERAVRLDDALPLGILGTLLQLTEDRSFKVRVLALVVHYLADDAPPVPDLMNDVLDAGLSAAAGPVALALSSIAAGNHDPGEGAAPSGPGTG